MATKSFTFSAQATDGLSVEAGALTTVTRKGTSTNITTYTDSGLVTPASNPHVANALGICGPLYWSDAVEAEVTFTVATADAATTLLQVDYADGTFTASYVQVGQLTLFEETDTGTGAQTIFVLQDVVASSPYQMNVTIDGVLQNKGSYTVTSDGTDTTVTFSEAPPNGGVIWFTAATLQALSETIAIDQSSATVLATGSTTARTLAARTADIINAKDYGVVGDGATDDTAALEAASLAAVGKTLFIPPGMNCLVQSTVDFDDANTRILAHGATFTQSATWSGTEVVRIGAINVTIEGLKIVGTEDGATTGIVTTTNAATGARIRQCDVSGTHYGITGNSNSDVLIEDNTVYNCSQYTIWCQNIADTQAYSNIRILNNDLDTSHLDPTTATDVCLLVRGGATNPTKDVKIVGNRMVMPTNPTSSAALGCEMRFIDGGLFQGNYGIDGAMTVSVAGSTDVSVIGNNCEGQTFYGIEIASISGVANRDIVVSGNTVDGNGILNYGIGSQGTDGSSRLTISGNTVKDTTLYGIFVNNQWDWVSITGNSVDMDVSGSLYGIYCLATTGAIDQMVISGNLLNGNAVAKKAIYIDDCSNVAITGNVMLDWAENPVLMRSETGTVDYITIVGNIVRGSANISTTGAGAFGTRIYCAHNPDQRFGNSVGTNFYDFAANLGNAWGTSDPESLISAGIGSTFLRTNGSNGTTYYVKESGTGNTGWLPTNALGRTATAASIAAVGNAVNTANKRAGVLIWDSTNNRALRASGSAAADPWHVLDGSVTVTPA